MNDCMKCGKELQVGDRVVWSCEDCAKKQTEEYDNKDQRIAELEQENEGYQKLINDICNKHRVGSLKKLEEQLENVMPFKTGQTLYSLNKRTNCIYELTFEQFMYKARRLKDGYVSNYSKEELSTTKEEAQAKLEELGENK